jgi:hypothetical protein
VCPQQPQPRRLLGVAPGGRLAAIGPATRTVRSISIRSIEIATASIPVSIASARVSRSAGGSSSSYESMVPTPMSAVTAWLSSSGSPRRCNAAAARRARMTRRGRENGREHRVAGQRMPPPHLVRCRHQVRTRRGTQRVDHRRLGPARDGGEQHVVGIGAEHGPPPRRPDGGRT